MRQKIRKMEIEIKWNKNETKKKKGTREGEGERIAQLIISILLFTDIFFFPTKTDC